MTQRPKRTERHLVLVGGGHAHLAVLRALARDRPPGVEVTLVTPQPESLYSGMIPGWMAGHYGIDELTINTAAVAERAGVATVLAEVTALDTRSRHLTLSADRRLEYDLLSLDVGGQTDMTPFAALGTHAIAVRPMATFVERWTELVDAASRQAWFQLAIVGAGAAGVELALAARQAFDDGPSGAHVTLLDASPDILTGIAPSAVHRVRRLLHQRGIALRSGPVSAETGALRLATNEVIQVDAAIIATGGHPPSWLRASGLELDDGRVAVDACHRSISHRDVFAAGDVCHRRDRTVGRSGVHAVRAGPVLARNLIAALHGGALGEYTPRQRSLYLLSTGDKRAILSWGAHSAEGAWVWKWKEFLDRRFVRRNRVGAGRHAAVA